MCCYFVAQININDPVEYQKYLDGTDEALRCYNGEVVAVDDNPAIMEGKWNYTRIVIIRFPDENALKSWYESPVYKQIVKHRWNASTADVLAVKGRK